MKIEIKNKLATGYEVQDIDTKKIFNLGVNKANIGDKFEIINPLFWNKIIVIDAETSIKRL